MSGLLWPDVETTGLDPATGHVLEYALAITDNELRVIDTFEVVVGHRNVRNYAMSDVVRRMHENNGLFDACERSPFTLEEAEAIGLVWMAKHGIKPDPNGRDDVGPYMAGSSPQFDRGFMMRHLPQLQRCFHYRNIDMTTLRYFFGSEKNSSIHRALPDVLQNVEDLRRHVARARAVGLRPMPALLPTLGAVA